MAVHKTGQTRRWRMALLVCAALQALTGAAQAGSVVYRATLLPLLGGQGYGTALAINSAGDVVGSNFDGSGGGPGGSWGSTYAFLYAGGVTSRVGPADTNQSRVDDRATALSEASGVMGTTYISGETGFNTEQRGFVQSYSALTGQFGSATTFAGPAGFARVGVQGVNSSGRVVGQAISNGNVRVAYVREADGQVLRLQDFGGRNSVARAVNDTGQIAGSADIPNVGSRAVLWQGGGMVGLGTLGGDNSAAFAISQNGWVVGDSNLQSQGQRHAFVWHDGAMGRVAANLDAGGSSRAEAVNALGQVAGVFTNAAGLMDRIFLDSPSGGSVELTGFNLAVYLDDDRVTQLPTLKINELGQISAGLHGDYGRAMVLSPSGTLSWAQSGGGRVAEPGNWDSGMGFAPNRLLDVVIGTFRDQTITADTTMEVKSLHVTGSKAGRATLQLTGGATVNALEGVTIEARGRLQGAGRVLGPVVLNHGTVNALPGQTLVLDGGLDNRGLVTGTGRIEANLINRGGGGTGVVVGAGQALTLAGTVHSAADGSHMHISSGGDLRFEGRFVNQGGATLQLDAGTLRVGFGSQRMDNGGLVQVGAGRSEIEGHVYNSPRGLIHASAGAQLFVWDALRNDGEVRATGGAQIVYTGLVTGPGDFTGQGEGGFHRFEGGYSPGASPADVSLGDVQMASLLTMEIGGLSAGSQHDRIHFTGSASFEETSFLSITLINNFVPHAGDVFALFSYALAPTGNFEDFYLPGLSAGLSWDVSQLHTTGVLAVTSVPEPAPAALWLAGLAGMGVVARRRAATRQR
jgi:probable HAF family extracellular repeat protein